MSKSLIERVSTINAPPDTSTKSLGYSGYENLFGLGYGGLDSRNRDFTPSEYGAAQASQMLVDIAASLNVWEQWLDGITWHIKDASTGKTIITTDQRVIPEGEKGARFFNAIKAYRMQSHHSYWKSLAISDWIAGETYVLRVRNQSNMPTLLQWLNPLATTPMIVSGKIQYYQYSNDDSVELGYTIPTKEVAYRMLRRNLFDDLRGYSPVLSVIDESNLSRNVKRAFRQYFRNGMILGGIVSPLAEETVYTSTEMNKLEDMIARNHRGVDNAHGWIISPRRFFAEQFDSKDVSKDIAILGDLRNSIMMAMGVPQELAGNPTDATYENLEATQYGWYRFKGIPYAKDIAEYHNNQIIPFLEPNSGIYIEPELAKYEIERPEVVSQDVTASVISLYDAQRKRGQQKADESLKDIYIVEGRPMHKDVLVKLANTMPSQEVEQRASAEESLANAQAKPIEAQADIADSVEAEQRLSLPEPAEKSAKALPNQREAFAYIPLANNSSVLRIQRRLKEALTDERIKWETAPTLHVTLCYAELVSDSAILEEMSKAIRPIPVALRFSKLDSFDTPDGKALHIRLQDTPELSELQSNVYVAFEDFGDGLSEYSKADNYNPHITLAYVPNDIDLSGLTVKQEEIEAFPIHSYEVIIGRDDYDPVLVLKAPEQKSVTISHGDHDHAIPITDSKAYSHDRALNELKAWKKFRKNDPSRDFVPEYTLGNVADGIQARIADNADLDTVFDEAFDTVKAWQKAIQSVRIDFEDSVQDIMDKALADNNYGRQQWSTAMRKIIRSACTRAYSDGLISGGVLDGTLSEEDENILASHIADQSQYVTNLGEKIFKTKEGISQALADQKPILWWNKTVLPMYDAGQLSANENRMMEFAGKDGEESCPTCTRLKGQRHRHKWWARKALRPGIDTDSFECGGWRCQHKLVPVQASETR